MNNLRGLGKKTQIIRKLRRLLTSLKHRSLKNRADPEADPLPSSPGSGVPYNSLPAGYLLTPLKVGLLGPVHPGILDQLRRTRLITALEFHLMMSQLQPAPQPAQ